ncbi:MAG: hypothetical protein J1E77_07585 [Prevotella sp.]|nr:hypothetical protein [Prevotella sp.]
MTIKYFAAKLRKNGAEQALIRKYFVFLPAGKSGMRLQRQLPSAFG